jgi:phage shock protein PspC (stress-responsive transcriptional regulator)
MPQLGTTATTTTTSPPAGGSSRSASDETSRPPTDNDSLHRGGPHRMLAGVAAGLAEYFDVDPTLVRVGFVALSFLGGIAVPLYLAGWLLIPDEGAELSVAEELLARERSR